MAEISDFSTTDASNTGRWPEGMAPSAVNDAGRADEGILARWFNDWNCSITASGSSNAFAITSNRTISSLVNNTVMAFTANHTITGAPTLNLNSLGAKSIKRFNGNALASGDIVSGQPVTVIYKSSPDVWFMMSAAAALTGNSFADFDENASPGDPASDDARIYAADVSGTTRVFMRDSAAVVTPLANELVAIIEDQKTQNTAAQTLSTGSDQVRELNTLVFNRNSSVSLSSNRFTLPAGTWEIEWSAPFHVTGGAFAVQSLLYNQSDSSEVKRSHSMIAGAAGSGDEMTAFSMGSAVVTITSAKAFEIRHRVGSSVAGGNPANFGTEVYTRVSVRRA